MEIEIWTTDEDAREIGVGVSLVAPDGRDFSVMERHGYEIKACIYDLSLANVDNLIEALQNARAMYVRELAA